MVICLEIYTGFVLVIYGKVVDTKTIPFERRVCYLQFPREVSMLHYEESHGEAPGLIRRQKIRESMAQLLFWFPWEGIDGAAV